PVDPVNLTRDVEAVATMAHSTCALTTGHAVKCWGHGDYLPMTGIAVQGTPADVPGMTLGLAAISMGSNHGVALTTGGALRCWGSSFWGPGCAPNWPYSTVSPWQEAH